MSRIRPGSLKCVVLARREALDAVISALTARAGDEDVREFGESAVLVHSAEEPSALRDCLGSAGVLMVLEFEKWSGAGEDVPSEWLLARGH